MKRLPKKQKRKLGEWLLCPVTWLTPSVWGGWWTSQARMFHSENMWFICMLALHPANVSNSKVMLMLDMLNMKSSKIVFESAQRFRRVMTFLGAEGGGGLGSWVLAWAGLRLVSEKKWQISFLLEKHNTAKTPWNPGMSLLVQPHLPGDSAVWTCCTFQSGNSPSQVSNTTQPLTYSILHSWGVPSHYSKVYFYCCYVNSQNPPLATYTSQCSLQTNAGKVSVFTKRHR